MRYLAKLAMTILVGLFLVTASIEAKADNDICTENEILNAVCEFLVRPAAA